MYITLNSRTKSDHSYALISSDMHTFGRMHVRQAFFHATVGCGVTSSVPPSITKRRALRASTCNIGD